MKIVVLRELKDYITPLSKEEFIQLEKNIIAEGCRDPLTVWDRGNQTVFIDGHNRHKICTKHNIPFRVKTLSFSDLDEVKAWMIDNQMGRRNLTPDQLSYYRGLRYLGLKKEKGGYQNVIAKGSSKSVTSELLSETFRVSQSTIKRDARFAEGLNIIGRSNPGLKNKILKGESKVSKSDIQTLCNSPKADKLTIKNEADLYNKAKAIREEILVDVEKGIKRIEAKRVDEARKILDEREPLFINKEDRLKKIKGKIISGINKAITDKDAHAIKELKILIDKLADEIFD